MAPTSVAAVAAPVAASTLDASIAVVTPAMAAAWLDLPPGTPFLEARQHVFAATSLANRTPAALAYDFALIDEYAQLMGVGLWRAGQERDPIQVHPCLADGPISPGNRCGSRHRLLAVLKVGRPIELLVTNTLLAGLIVEVSPADARRWLGVTELAGRPMLEIVIAAFGGVEPRPYCLMRQLQLSQWPAAYGIDVRPEVKRLEHRRELCRLCKTTRLAKAMSSGQWNAHPDVVEDHPVEIADDRCQAGRYRLLAVIKTGKPQRLLVQFRAVASTASATNPSTPPVCTRHLWPSLEGSSP